MTKIVWLEGKKIAAAESFKDPLDTLGNAAKQDNRYGYETYLHFCPNLKSSIMEYQEGSIFCLIYSNTNHSF